MGPAWPGPGLGRQGLCATCCFSEAVFWKKKTYCTEKVIISTKSAYFRKELLRDKPKSFGNGPTSSGTVYL